MLCPRREQNEGTIKVLLVIIFLIQSFRATSKLISSNQSVRALADDDVILPCRLEPAFSASNKTVTWTKPGLYPKYIHVYHQGRLVHHSQHPSYFMRTALFENELSNGNVSLKLFRVKISDAGEYFCTRESTQKAASIQLIVGAVSKPVIEIVSSQAGGLVLQCNATGWYPEPEVFWLDGEGNLLSAGPPETVRGPDDLYTVSSRVTVEKRHGNSFTCRVTEKKINQTRETEIQVPDDLFVASSCVVWCCYVSIITSIASVLTCTVLLSKRFNAACCKRNQGHESEENKEEKDEQQDEDEKRSALIKRTKITKNQKAVENDYQDLPVKGKTREPERGAGWVRQIARSGNIQPIQPIQPIRVKKPST